MKKIFDKEKLFFFIKKAEICTGNFNLYSNRRYDFVSWIETRKLS